MQSRIGRYKDTLIVTNADTNTISPNNTSITNVSEKEDNSKLGWQKKNNYFF